MSLPEGTKPIKSISIVMCTYNGEKYLREQLESIVSQTYPIYELIIQDDRSSDSTLEIIKEYAANYSYIRWKVNEKNLGYNANFRTAIQDARGEFISISDQDDIWYANKLEELVKCIGNSSMCHSFSISQPQATVVSIKQAVNNNNTLERSLFSNVILGHCMLLKKDFIDQLTVWNDDFFYDWWLAVNSYLHQGASQCEQILTDHRIHPESVTCSHKAKKVKPHLPYIKGYSSFKALQKQPNWQFFYQHIYNKSKNRKELAVAHRIAGLMLQKGPLPFLSLCFLSMRYRKRLMPRSGVNMVRAFFYPCFFAYQNDRFETPVRKQH